MLPILLARTRPFFKIAILFFFFSLFFYLHHLRSEVKWLKSELARTNEELYSCQQTNVELTKELKLQAQKYKRKVAHLLKLANKPPKVIKIPQIIEKKIYVTPKECKQMALMIDEFIQKQKKEQEECEK
jgi:cell shape-determining protein MreC